MSLLWSRFPPSEDAGDPDRLFLAKELMKAFCLSPLSPFLVAVGLPLAGEDDFGFQLVLGVPAGLGDLVTGFVGFPPLPLPPGDRDLPESGFAPPGLGPE